MINAWNWVLNQLGLAPGENQMRLVDELDNRLWSLVQDRLPSLKASQVNGYVWARARATGLLPRGHDSETVVHTLVDRFVTRIDAQQQVSRRAA